MTDVQITERLGQCYTGVVHDILRGMGVRNFTLPHEITPLIPQTPLCGPAFTIEGHPDDTADPHETLLAWTGLLSTAPAGHVWVCQPHTHDIAQMGELSAETLKNKGVRGCVLDGLARDTHFLIDIGFQCWRRGHTPRDIVGRWLPVATGHMIHIGDVAIANGDFLLGDRDGMVRVPRAVVAEVTEKATEAMQTESKVRKAILGGTDPQKAYLKYGKF
ncbi:regulator of RNase E activity RraA [Rhodovulum imhoffii]|uniref:Putative 4-hydroxy-4-methyl-2-oxoglutarate aldolase n=1 Tax=Rhodovulum imhoffii TaxID=365340 RepID=A0A2T5BSE3_9RHOB|nr:RraA family protein [Rhodovulum imhoffii]MBK5933504.1 methyltransferase [Rhodovulum imhoffii]PTN02260.1 regulator of RNase E activity RraA [Rhodovulum imhoffii]